MATFISYSRANSDFAVQLASDLKAAGLDVWLDQLDIPTGARWDDEIERALEKSSIFLIILSPESIESQNVKDEVGLAIDSGKHILPVLTKSCKIPLRLRRFQFVDSTNQPYEDSLAEIKDLLSNTKKLAANENMREASGVVELPPSHQQPTIQGKPISQANRGPSHKSKAQKMPQAGYLALIFLGVCAAAVVCFMGGMMLSPDFRNLILPASPTRPIISTTVAPGETPIPPIIVTTAVGETQIPPVLITTMAPTEPSITPTVRLSLCDQLVSKSLNIKTANGFQGVIGPSGILLITQDNASYGFTTVAAFSNEQIDAVSGNCTENTLVFTRTRPKAFIQDYQATISQSSSGALALEGSLTNRATGQKLIWSGQVSEALTPNSLCEQLAGKSLTIKTTNGFQGVLAPAGLPLIPKGNGLYSFTTVVTFLNEPADPVSGNCQKSTLTFTRTRVNVFIQDFQATISQNPGGSLYLEGSLTNQASGRKSMWSGQVTEAHP